MVARSVEVPIERVRDAKEGIHAVRSKTGSANRAEAATYANQKACCRIKRTTETR